ncbi:MAG TPA: hypothetical protein VFE62_20965 [Gemmataceae bacterium]|nr:hypothetical protein [Gemmataceae bacterium]
MTEPTTNPLTTTAPISPPAVLHEHQELEGEQDVTVIARYPYQMEKCQAELIEWAKRKIAVVETESRDLAENLEIAKKNQWGTGGLYRAHQRSVKREEFYRKILAALDAGHCIVPNFPVDIIAVRTTRRNPSKGTSTDWSDPHTQASECPPIGDGEFKAANPVIYQRKIEYERDGKQITEKEYWAEAFAEFDFPFTTAKPEILSATARAMQDKFFDEIGVLPGKKKREDPIIVGRIYDPSSSKENDRDWAGRRRSRSSHTRFVTFLIAWFVDTRTL